MLLLLSFWIITGLMAEDPTRIYYRPKNSSVCLQVGKPPPYKGPKWTFTGKTIVANEELNPKYQNKVIYSPKNLSLCINNLVDNDTGTYDVSYTDSDFNSVSEKHQVIIQEIVPRPVVMMSERGSNMSVGLCSIAVNCSIQDDWLLSVCIEDSCEALQKSFSEVNITIFSDNRTVICSGRNHVSTSNTSESLMTCFSKLNTAEEEESQQRSPMGILTIIFTVCVVFFFLIFSILAKRQVAKKCKSYPQQTSTVRSIQSQPMGTLPSFQPRVSTGSSSSDADAAYENADIIQLSQTSSPASKPREEMSAMEKVDTIYRFPDGKASSANNMQNTSEAAATEEEAQRRTQIDTVYSVLQKPKNLNPQHHQAVKQHL